MKISNRSKIVIVGIGFILFGIGCFLLGQYQTQKYVAKLMMNHLYETASISVSQRVTLLKLLHSGQIDKGEEMLEKLVDVELGTLALYSKVPPKQRDSRIIGSIRSVKEYRKMFPQHQVHPNIANSVKMALDLAK